MAKDFIIVTDKGLIAPKAKEPTEVMAQLMYAYLELWNDEMFEIDVVDAAEKIVDLLGSMQLKKKGRDEIDDEIEELIEGCAKFLADYLCGKYGDDDVEDDDDEDEGHG